ncbi:hypothetical protein CBS147343_2613 [Aspergillus niger]|uniref:Nucleoside phosphorylase domain-containing protein n=1 Tax=Aspergillus niger TaxID=5061 RepID=A0A9W5ZUE1_ASPNG|nr:hypothetical protein CBS11350_2240 [Aspergillus niger]KAI2863196.1 hypothetical protein CBS12448_3991 [Aspergillus niger]KAI2904810.1 hypothetical protein CBS13152_842 [Aspergillus niger]KAI2911517.1 hypothetical protein CBS147371_8133 [Aspergillus niger]KAI2931875.1 hypothetical protein CBS147320_2556 [Aspergillus niger]
MSQLLQRTHEPTISQINYLIGWICIHPNEYYEAVKMFDENHDSTHIVRGRDDKNSYDIGRIGNHLVVMNCPASGINGQSRAATIASDMRSTFPGIRFMFLVGTGGGAPSHKQDVRLGDVVLGTQVIPYQKREMTVDGHEIISQIATPPAILHSAMTRLEFKLRQGLNLHETIQKLGTPSLPRPTKDRLYSTNYNHCSSHCDCLSTKVRALHSICLRSSRDGGDLVKVHQGPVGSASNAMRDVSCRDEYADLLGILCYETEAVTIMETVSCLTVCGISDYCDGHDYDGWHAYASLSAAVCTKELLHIITDVASLCSLEVTEGELERFIQGTLEEVDHSLLQAANPQHEYQTLDRNIDMIIERYRLVQDVIVSKLYHLENQMDPENVPQFCDAVSAMKQLQQNLQTYLNILHGRVTQQAERQPKGTEMHETWRSLGDKIDDWMRWKNDISKATQKILGNQIHASQYMSLRMGESSTVPVRFPSAQQSGQPHHQDIVEQPKTQWIPNPLSVSTGISPYGASIWNSAHPASTTSPISGSAGSPPISLLTLPRRSPSLPSRPSSAIENEDTPSPLPPQSFTPVAKDEAIAQTLQARVVDPPRLPNVPDFEHPIPPSSLIASAGSSQASAKSSLDITTVQDQHLPSMLLEQTMAPPSTTQPEYSSPEESSDSSLLAALSPPSDRISPASTTQPMSPPSGESSDPSPAAVSSPPLEQTIDCPSTPQPIAHPTKSSDLSSLDAPSPAVVVMSSTEAHEPSSHFRFNDLLKGFEARGIIMGLPRPADA